MPNLAASTPAALAVPATFEKECVALFAGMVQIFGVPKSVGQIYGLLFASPEPLGFPEIVERLQISKGSVSQGIQLLKALGAINEVARVPAISNQEFQVRRSVAAYEPELSLRQLVIGVLRERIAPMAQPGAERLKRLKELAEQTPEHIEFYFRRAKQLETWRKRFTTVLPLLTALLGPKKKSK